jgi:hypothetical protein
MPKSPQEQFSDEEIARRRDDAIRRALKTPPKPHKDMKLGTRKVKTKKAVRSKAAASSQP